MLLILLTLTLTQLENRCKVITRQFYGIGEESLENKHLKASFSSDWY
jgi:hypothetical protein